MGLNNRNRIIFNSILGLKTFKEDPIGYNDLETTLGRSKKTHGVFTSITQNLEFTFEAREYLLNLFFLEGVNARCTMKRQQRDPYTDQWINIDEGMLDMSRFKYTKTTCTTDYIENSFSEKFDNFKKEDFEIDRITDIDGLPIDEMIYKKLVLSGRQVFLRSRLYMDSGDKIDFDNSNSNKFENEAVMLKVDFNSDPENIVSVYTDDMNENNQSLGSGRAGNMFYLRADRPRSIVLNGRMSGTMNPARSAVSFRVELVKYGFDENGNYPLVSAEQLYRKSDFTNRSFSFDFVNKRIDVDTDESLALVVSVIAEGRSNLIWDDCGFEITEDSSFKTTTTNTASAFEVGQRLVKSIDSEAEFESDLLTGEFKNLLMTSGESIRNVKRKDDEGIETKIPILTTSFEDFFNAINTITPVAYDVVFKEGKNVVTLNKIDDYFVDETIVRIGHVGKIENEVDYEWVYSGVRIGYDKSGDIEGVYGLQATHTVNTYTLPIDRVENIYEAVTDYRCDPNEIETQRREQYIDFPEKDSKYDKDIFLFDAQPQGTMYVLRPNSTDFESVSGVYAADTTYNNRLSPGNCLLRHAKVFKSGMDRFYYSTKFLRYASTNGNPNLITSKNGVTTPEKLTRRIDQLESPIFAEVKITFETIMEQSIYQALKTSNNRYRSFEYINDNGGFEKGFLYKIDFGNSIKYELRKIKNG